MDLFYPGGKNLVFNVVAISSPLKGEGVTAAGGANLDYKHLTLEIPFLKYGSWEFEHSIGVLAHEVAHILFGISGKRNIERQILVKSRIGDLIKILNGSGREIIE